MTDTYEPIDVEAAMRHIKTNRGTPGDLAFCELLLGRACQHIVRLEKAVEVLLNRIPWDEQYLLEKEITDVQELMVTPHED